jgi:hypothetical protein
VHAGGAGHRAEHLDHAGVQALDAGLELSAWDAARIPSRSSVPVVTG